MNTDNVRKAIAVMQRAKNLQMGEWQATPKGTALGEWCAGGWLYGEGEAPLAKSVDALHECGNTACFAGYIAVSEEFQSSGGRVDPNGQPVLGYPGPRNGVAYGSYAIAVWLGIDNAIANKLCFGQKYAYSKSYSHFYGKPFEDVTPQDVINQLEKLLRG